MTTTPNTSPERQRRFYIVGCQRSGTTLVRLIMDCHSLVQCYDEPLAYKMLAGTGEARSDVPIVGFKVPQLTDQLFRDTCCDYLLPAFSNSYSRQPVIFMVRNVRDTVASMYSLRWRRQSWMDAWCLPCLDHKMKDQEFRLRYGRLLPANCSSHESRIQAAAVYWRYNADALDIYSRHRLPVLAVRYEDLVTDPARHIAHMCDHVAVNMETRMRLHHTVPHTQLASSGLAMGKTDPRRAVDDDSIGRWRGVLTSADLEIIEKVAGERDRELYPNQFNWQLPMSQVPANEAHIWHET